jgi:transposase
MVDVGDDAKGGGFRRIEVLTGPGRRRKWSDDDKARIVAETLEPGAVVAEVARRWQVCPQQVHGWRRERRLGTAGPASPPPPPPEFVPIVAEPPAAEPASSGAAIEVAVAGAVVRVSPGVDPALLSAVLRALRASGP